MGNIFNIYCDESCHLENDHQPIMVLGCIWCPLEKTREISIRIREIKRKHGLPPHYEIKWSKVSPGKERFYMDLVDYFFDDDDLHFRAIIISNKDRLRHHKFLQDHDTWYYKMQFDLLKVLLDPRHKYRIYLDIKDTRSADKVKMLHKVLSNNQYDFERRIIERVQTIRSHESEEMQLADLLVGIISYHNRGLNSNKAKVALVNRMKQRSGYNLTQTTLSQEVKVNLFRWQPREAPEDE